MIDGFRLLFFLSLFLWPIFNRAAGVQLFIYFNEKNDLKKIKIDYQQHHKDSVSAIHEVRSVLFKLYQQSYLTAHIESMKSENGMLKVWIDAGETFTWIRLSKGNLSEVLLSKSNFKEKNFLNKPFRAGEFSRLMEDIITYSESNGYPFASVKLDSLHISANSVFAALNYSSGPRIVFDSLRIVGKTKIKSKFLARHLRIFQGQPFSQEKINDIDKLLKELIYIEQTEPYMVEFFDNKCRITIFINDRKVNQIDGIAGFLPNESKNNKLLITGEINLNLKNISGTGKNLSAEWKKIKEETQTLEAMYLHPKILGAGLDVKTNLNLLKQDSSFLTINRKITLYHRSGKQGSLGFISGFITSRMLYTADTTTLRKLLLSDYNLYNYGLSYSWNNLNNLFYPRKGWMCLIEGTVGNKTIRKNAKYSESLYSNIQLQSRQLNIEIKIERFNKLSKAGVLYLRFYSGKLFNNRPNIFLNDLFRLGGLRTIRGFNENTFYASTYATATTEFRFYTDETSYLFIFADQGYIDNMLNENRRYDYPLGFGAGISFTTPAGIFNFVYSLGRSNDQRISINLSKIHFGIISRF
ncbi:MAG: BamA/TamA family outer membrane protein [Cytophagaceae bacterium]|nr:BamA/TamA family outer membrane protein [Cytophagaceae bacterium]MDW8455197.1 BamA/TamA family outer membrane protein [Cytophagaceae bacterium]